MKTRTIIILLLVVAAAGAGVFYFLKNKKEKAKPQWLTERAQFGDIKIAITATGTVNAGLTVQVGTQVSGVISKILVDFNDKVRAGQVIAMIDTATLHDALQSAQAGVGKANAQLVQSKNEMERTQMLWDKKVISASDYDVAVSAFKVAKNTLQAASADFAKAKTNLRYATIRAPIDGIIISRNVDVGQTVAASLATPTLFVVANDLKKMLVTANVDEADIGQVKVGQPVIFKVDAYPDSTFHGVVQQIRLQSNVVQNVVNYSVMIDAPNLDLKLLPGMNTEVSIIVNQKIGVLGIPVAALQFVPPAIRQDTGKMAALKTTLDNLKTEGKTQVFILENGQLKPVSIEKGLSDGVWMEVGGGALAENAVVIIGVKGTDKVSNTKSLFQQPKGVANMRRMQ